MHFRATQSPIHQATQFRARAPEPEREPESEHDREAGPRRREGAAVGEARLRRAPVARERAATGVSRNVDVVALVVHARRRDPRVLVVEVALLRLRDRLLVPRVPDVDRVSERVVLDERLGLAGSAVEVRGTEQDPDLTADLAPVGPEHLSL